MTRENEAMMQNILDRILHILNERGMKQSALLKLCEAKGYHVTQSEMSRILGGRVALRLYPVIAICDALELDLEELIHPERNKEQWVTLQEDAFITEASDPECRPYVGRYHVLFHSTDAQEQKIIRGEMIIGQAAASCSNECIVSFSLNTGLRGPGGEAFVKKYRGRFIISKKLGIAYLFLVNNHLGEICSVEVRHRIFFYKRVECRIGLALTVSAGESKNPALHQLALYRGDLSPAQEEELVHMLKMKNEGIRVEESKMKAFCLDYPQKELAEAVRTMATKETSCLIDEGVVRMAGRKFGTKEQSSLFNALKQLSEDPFTLRLEESDDNQLWDWVRTHVSENGEQTERKSEG